MQQVIENINNFKQANLTALKNTLTEQIKEHFNFLVENISTIKNIQFSFYQIDEDSYAMTDFVLTKDNGYIYRFVLEQDNESISHWEFFKSQIEVIDAFMNYLASISYQCVSVLGGGTLTFDNKNCVENY